MCKGFRAVSSHLDFCWMKLMGCVQVLLCRTFECVSVREVVSQWDRSSGKASQLLSCEIAVCHFIKHSCIQTLKHTHTYPHICTDALSHIINYHWLSSGRTLRATINKTKTGSFQSVPDGKYTFWHIYLALITSSETIRTTQFFFCCMMDLGQSSSVTQKKYLREAAHFCQRGWKITPQLWMVVELKLGLLVQCWSIVIRHIN